MLGTSQEASAGAEGQPPPKIVRNTRNVVDEAYRLFPGRKAQINHLLDILPTVNSAIPIFITGPPGTGKTSVTKHVFSFLKPDRVAWINCVVRYSPRLIFESALSQFSGSQPEPVTDNVNGPWTGMNRCEHLPDFIAKLEKLPATQTLFLVLDHAERLRNMGSTFLESLLRLPLVVKKDLTIILLSDLSWPESFGSSGSSLYPYTIQFPSYNRSETLDIITLDCPPGEDLDFFRSFVEILYDVFITPCRDINELRHLVALLFPKYMEPVVSGKAIRAQGSKLFTYIQPHIKEALHSLYLRDVSSSEWQAQSQSSSDQQQTGISADVDLPYFTKFLLLSAFLASYNPPRLDVRFFTREGGKDIVKRKGGRRGRKSEFEGGKMRQQLLGPKSFPLERMLAIFYSILSDDTAFLSSSIDIQTEIATLITLRLLVRISSPDRLDGVKCKCMASYEFVKAVGRSVRFDLAAWLHDFM
ncbi:origin recognition complex subunit 5 C-terminus-domain-containing protein [Gaertneriomyces semiglobifer]|nr:origin recognition complex subunit 5 C-terminus-domain-containing protein [Gaertneriomyces semiglobifer]